MELAKVSFVIKAISLFCKNLEANIGKIVLGLQHYFRYKLYMNLTTNNTTSKLDNQSQRIKTIIAGWLKMFTAIQFNNLLKINK